MARYTNIFGGSIASCCINGRSISVINGEVYVDGILYVPASEAGGEHKPFTSGKIVEHRFDVSPSFNSIDNKGFVDVVFQQSAKDDDFEVRGMLPENLIDKLNVYVEEDRLVISMKAGTYESISFNGQAPTIYVTNKNLVRVGSHGSGDFKINGDLKVLDGGFYVGQSGSGDFKAGTIFTKNRESAFSTSGSGNIALNGAESSVFMVRITGSANVACGTVKTKICSIEVGGSGDVTINGSTDTVDFSIAGSGNIEAGGFKAKSGKASVTGSGAIRCNVERLSDRVRGSGDIYNRY